MTNERFNYAVLQQWSKDYYKGLLGKEMVHDLVTVFKNRFVLLHNGLHRYLLPIDALEELPLLPTSTEVIDYRGKPYTVVTAYKSARFKPQKHMDFRQLVDDLCAFKHEASDDYRLWKILALASLIGRTSFRICSPPAFGKDSVMKVLGFLTGDVCVIANPTVAKLEYRLTNKVLLLNEFANLKSDDRYGMEHFLQSVGDMSNTYEKRTRAGTGTAESFDISELSVVCAYNDLACYTETERYFDMVFSQQTKDRFIPYKFTGKIAEEISNVADPQLVATEQAEYLQQFMRTIVYYRQSWRDELTEKRSWNVKDATAYGMEGRWANNYNRQRDFVLLYAQSPEEAQRLLNILINRHNEYLEQFDGGSSLHRVWRSRESEEPIETTVIEEDVI